MPRKPTTLKDDIERSLRARENGDPRRFIGLDYMTVFANAGIPMRKVPQQHWLMDGEPTKAVVNCPCGHGASIGAMEYPAKCPGEDCPRSFFFDGTAVWALLSPTS